MTYYLTTTSPLIFTTQKAERVEEWMIQDMLELLLKREYEMYETEDAAENINYWLRADSAFRDAMRAPEPLSEQDDWQPSQTEITQWVEDLLWQTEAGSNLRSQIGAPLHKQKEEERRYLSDETTLSDLMEGMTSPSDWDSAGPEMHSRMSNPSSED